MGSSTKLIVIVVGLGIVVGVFLYLFNRVFDQDVAYTSDPKNRNQTQLEDDPITSNAYKDLRNQALSFTTEGLGIKLPSHETKVFGVVMDWNLGSGMATFVSLTTGDASMYTSSGGGLIGGIGHANVRNASIKFVETAEKFRHSAQRSDDISLAKTNSVKFFFLTTNGRFVAEEQMQDFDNGSSKWLELFEEANNVIAELREISDDFEK